MFDNLTGRLSGIIDKLRGRGALNEADVKEAMREVRIALLEADVALPVVKDFIQSVQDKAIGQQVLSSVQPGQMVVKIVHDHLVSFLGDEVKEVSIHGAPPAVVLMVGLQGSGKTTMTSKIAHYVSSKTKKKVLMASLDIYRPAAREQLATLGASINVTTLPILANETPDAIAQRALHMAKTEGYDVLLLDTAGRLHIDDELMDEVIRIKELAKPAEIILVADAMTGQDAVNVAREFNEKIGVTGIALSRVDGDARGGAALSMRAVTGRPLLYLGVGERPQELELFHPERIASRILGMGDVVSLVERAMETVDQDEAEKLAKKMQKGGFDLSDLESQLLQISKMGGLSSIMGMLPGMHKVQDKMANMPMDDSMIKRQIAIIRSMTPQERKNPDLLGASRKKRVASGSGVNVQEVNKLLKQFKDMSSMMKRMQKMGKMGLMRQGLKGLLSR